MNFSFISKTGNAFPFKRKFYFRRSVNAQWQNKLCAHIHSVDNYASFFNCTPAGRWPRLKAINFIWLEPERLVGCLAYRSSNGVFYCSRVSV